MYIVFVFYSPPGVEKMVVADHFELVLGSLSSYKYPLIACGDLNIENLKSNLLTGKYLDIIDVYGFMMMGEHTTRVTHQSSIFFEKWTFSLQEHCFFEKPHEIERLSFVFLDNVSRLDFRLCFNSIIRLFMQILIGTSDKAVPLKKSGERIVAKPAWCTNGNKNFISKRSQAHKEW